MAARCATWRFTDVGDIARILPVGEDHAVWKPCRNRVAVKGAWCDECVTAMLLCPEHEIRRALVEMPDLEERFLRDLSSDPDYITSTRAAQILHERSGIWS